MKVKFLKNLVVLWPTVGKVVMNRYNLCKSIIFTVLLPTYSALEVTEEPEAVLWDSWENHTPANPSRFGDLS